MSCTALLVPHTRLIRKGHQPAVAMKFSGPALALAALAAARITRCQEMVCAHLRALGSLGLVEAVKVCVHARQRPFA